MSLYLIEISFDAQDEAAFSKNLDRISDQARSAGGQLIEAQVGLDAGRAFIIVEGGSEEVARSAAESAGLPVLAVKEVLLVGQELEAIKERAGQANYLVEWNFPEGLDMETYLQRKKEKSPLYAQVPEVSFERTYVCTDMSKCLCLYDSPDEATVRKAREVVDTPVDTLTRIKKL